MDLLKLHSITNKLLDRMDNMEKVHSKSLSEKQRMQMFCLLQTVGSRCVLYWELLDSTVSGPASTFVRGRTWKECKDFPSHVEVLSHKNTFFFLLIVKKMKIQTKCLLNEID